MHSGTAGFSRENVGRLLIKLSPCVAVVSLVYLFWGLLSSAEAYGDVEHGFSLLVAFGAVGGLGYLATLAYRNSRHLASACSLLDGTKPLEVRRFGGILVDSANWPLLVALLFGPFFVLLAGLGGWV